MKSAVLILIFVLPRILPAQPSSPAQVFARALAQRNASLLHDDSLSKKLEQVYTPFFEAVQVYKNSNRNLLAKKQLIRNKRLLRISLYTVLNRTERKQYRQLARHFGNLLLLPYGSRPGRNFIRE